MGQNLSAPSPGDDLRSESAIRLRRQTVRSDSFWEIGCDFSAVTMHFAMKNGQTCFSLRKFLAISPAIQKIASDCGCDAVVHLGQIKCHFWDRFSVPLHGVAPKSHFSSYDSFGFRGPLAGSQDHNERGEASGAAVLTHNVFGLKVSSQERKRHININKFFR